MTSDLAEALTAVARKFSALARQHAIWFSFDYGGPPIIVGDAAEPLLSVADALLQRALDHTDPGAGSIFFLTHVWPKADAEYRVRLMVAFTGARGTTDDALTRQAQRTRQGDPCAEHSPVPLELVEHGLPPGATYWESHVPDEGTVIEVEWVLTSSQAQEIRSGRSLYLPQAWLIGVPAQIFDRLAMRFQRDGWIVRVFPTVKAAQALLATAGRAPPPPALAVAVEDTGPSHGEFVAWADELPADTRLIWAVSTDRPRPAAASRIATGVQALTFPFSPADLRDLKDAARLWESARNEESRPAPLDALGRSRVLVVDDNLVNQLVATGMLTMLGYEVDVAQHGLEAVEYCQRFRPSAVLMDFNMPVMNGMEATRRIRELERGHGWPRIHIVGVTTQADSGDRAQYLASGMDVVLAKPLALDELQRELARLMGA